MKNRKILISFLILLATSLACQAVTGVRQTEQTSTPASARLATTTLASTSESVLEATRPVKPSPDPEAAATPTQTTPGDLEAALTEMPILPMGTPFTDDSYKSVPVMPGAQNASETEASLVYYVAQPPDKVLAYYQDAMPADDWQLLSSDTESTDSAVLIYTEGDKIATIAIMPNPAGGDDSMIIIAVP